MATVDWCDFEPSALEAARREDRPILLLLTVPWCPHCEELLRTTFTNPDVVDIVQSTFAAMRADADRRPDVNDRYGTGGWPTIAFLTPDGELISHENYLSADQLLPLLGRVRDAYGSRADEIRDGVHELQNVQSRAGAASPSDKLSAEIIDDVVDAIWERFDHRYGGWGDTSKFPHPEAIDFATVQVAKRSDERMREVVTLTLDKMMEGAIHDHVDGGFFRYSETPDWRSPNFEKVLDANVQRMRCYLEGFQVVGAPAYRRVAEGIIDWMTRFLLDPETRAFFGSQDADADYYLLGAEDRRDAQAPKIDQTIYAHANAMAVSNLCKASVVLSRPDLREQAMATLGFLLERLSDRDGEVYHYWDGTYHLPGLLLDQAHMIRALIDASQLTGDADLLLPAEKIAENVIERQRAPGGGFYDILENPAYTGSMRRRNRSILENSIMAEALVRLSYLSRRSVFYDEALTTLEAFTTDYKEYGYYVAGYGRAVDLIYYPPLTVTIVGARDGDEAQNLRDVALGGYVPSRIVQTLDPERDPVLLERSGYPVEDAAVAHLSVGRTTKSVARSADELAEQMSQLEAERRAAL